MSGVLEQQPFEDGASDILLFRGELAHGLELQAQFLIGSALGILKSSQSVDAENARRASSRLRVRAVRCDRVAGQAGGAVSTKL
jgi:hypothetical protein